MNYHIYNQQFPIISRVNNCLVFTRGDSDVCRVRGTIKYRCESVSLYLLDTRMYYSHRAAEGV